MANGPEAVWINVRRSGLPQRCDVCGQDIPLARYSLHARGLDGARPECPLTDLVEIALRARGEWDARTRYQEISPARVRRLVRADHARNGGRIGQSRDGE